MSMTGLDAFDKTVQTTNTWLNEINDVLGPDRKLAWHVLSAVLRVVRDRFPVDLAAHLGAELPLIVRGAYYDQFRPAAQPQVTRSREEFLQHVAKALRGTRPVNPEAAVRAVLNVLSRHMPYGQIAKLREALPADIRPLWPDAGIEQQPERQAAERTEEPGEPDYDVLAPEADADRRQGAKSLRRARAEAREMSSQRRLARGAPGSARKKPRGAAGKAPTRH